MSADCQSVPQIVPMTAAHADHLAPEIAAVDPWHRLGISQTAIHSMLTAQLPDHMQRTILAGSEPVGAIVVHLDWLLGPYLRHLSIHESVQGQGYGTAAIAWLNGLAEDRKQANVWLCVSEFNVKAERFYLGHGFERAAILKDLLIAGENELLMRRAIG